MCDRCTRVVCSKHIPLPKGTVLGVSQLTVLLAGMKNVPVPAVFPSLKGLSCTHQK